MYGAILGDIIGSPFEFDRGNKSKNFELFTRGCGFTDDSVMTCAVAEALFYAGNPEQYFKETLIDNLADVLKYAKLSAEVTHNHPEGIKGAQAVASAIFLA